MLHLICNKDLLERNFYKVTNSILIIFTSVTGPTASVHGLMLSIYYSFNMRFAAFLNPLVLPATFTLTATYSLVIPPYLTPVVNFI